MVHNENENINSMKKKILVFLFYMISLPISGSDQNFDARFIGKWTGSRDPGGQCQFLAWKTEYTKDHKIYIEFFSDNNFTKFIKTETGSWIADGNKITIFIYPEMSIDSFSYKFINSDKIEFISVSTDKSGDCQENNYKFTEIRVSEKIS